MSEPAGRYGVRTFTHDSEVLAGNRLGDPARREVLVLAPERLGDAPMPVVHVLPGFGSRGRGMLADQVFGTGLTTLMDRLVGDGTLPPTLLVLPDPTTRYGGSQYLDSWFCGAYQSYLVDEIVPAVERWLPADPARRAVLGKSSGGYGALMAALGRPGVFGHVLAHSPDAGFEHCYLGLLRPVLDTFAARGGLAAVASRRPGVLPADGEPGVDAEHMVAMSLVGMAACYAPEGTTDVADAFPCDPGTGVFRDDVWRRWLEFDPVRLVPARAPALRALDLLYIDVGRRDEYGMRWGARALHAMLADHDVAHEFEEHDGGHHGLEHRFARSLARLGSRWRAASCAA